MPQMTTNILVINGFELFKYDNTCRLGRGIPYSMYIYVSPVKFKVLCGEPIALNRAEIKTQDFFCLSSSQIQPHDCY